jgi:hypothetical protein
MLPDTLGGKKEISIEDKLTKEKLMGILIPLKSGIETYV